MKCEGKKKKNCAKIFSARDDERNKLMMRFESVCTNENKETKQQRSSSNRSSNRLLWSAGVSSSDGRLLLCGTNDCEVVCGTHALQPGPAVKQVDQVLAELKPRALLVSSFVM